MIALAYVALLGVVAVCLTAWTLWLLEETKAVDGLPRGELFED